MLLLNTSPKELGLELVRVLFVGLVIGILGGLAANLFVLGVGAIDGLIREQMVGQSALSAGLIRWAALIAGAFGIYGLKQSGRVWWHTLRAWLGQRGFTQDAQDPCVFASEDKGVIVGVYVDDLVALGPGDVEGFVKILHYLLLWLLINHGSGADDLSDLSEANRT